MGILSAAIQHQRAKKLEAELVTLLREADAKAAATGNAALGIDVPLGGEHADLFALAVNRILTKFPGLTAVRFADHITLAPRRALQQTTSQNLFEYLNNQGCVSQPGRPLVEARQWT